MDGVVESHHHSFLVQCFFIDSLFFSKASKNLDHLYFSFSRSLLVSITKKMKGFLILATVLTYASSVSAAGKRGIGAPWDSVASDLNALPAGQKVSWIYNWEDVNSNTLPCCVPVTKMISIDSELPNLECNEKNQRSPSKNNSIFFNWNNSIFLIGIIASSYMKHSQYFENNSRFWKIIA